jgi:hypothetical protein
LCWKELHITIMSSTAGGSGPGGSGDDNVPEEIKVLFHACAIGRTDVVQNAVSALRQGKSAEELAKAISVKRREDEATPLHVAVNFAHNDVIRALLVRREGASFVAVLA